VLFFGRPLSWQSLRSFGGLVAAAGVLALAPVGVSAKEAAKATDTTVSLHALPPEAQTTHRLIHTGGPFPYAKDGSVFGNRERLLPRQPRGFYREYTVKTPGARNRGAKRIVCGGEQPKLPEACYYTQDHYASFLRIAP
jgi:ribonuclease T1